MEIMIGRKPKNAADLACWSGPDLKNAVEMRLPAERADVYRVRLADSFDRMHEQVRSKDEHDRRKM